MGGLLLIFWRKILREGDDRTLFIHKTKSQLLVAQIYVNDIVFRATSSDLALSFAKEIKSEFKMSMVVELNFFLGLQIRQLKDDIFLSQSKYVRELEKKFGLKSTKHSKTPIDQWIFFFFIKLKQNFKPNSTMLR